MEPNNRFLSLIFFHLLHLPFDILIVRKGQYICNANLSSREFQWQRNFIMERSLLSMLCQTAPRTFQLENRWWHSVALTSILEVAELSLLSPVPWGQTGGQWRIWSIGFMCVTSEIGSLLCCRGIHVLSKCGLKEVYCNSPVMRQWTCTCSFWDIMLIIVLMLYFPV